MTTYAVTGYAGHIGQELLRYPGFVPLAGDVRNRGDIDLAVRNTRPDIIVHLASISNVDECEDPKNETKVKDVNVIGTMNVAEVAEKYGCEMVLLSTAHVFDGKWGNYKEKSKPHPINFYGFTKLACEGFRTIYPFMKTVRTSYLFDYERLFGHVYALRSGSQQEYDYPTFIERSFMYLPHFSEAFYNYLLRYAEMPQILHISGSRTVSWYEFVRDMASVYGLDSSLVCPRNYEIDKNIAPRPYKAGLNVGLSKRLELPQYGYLEGLQEMREVGG